MVLDDIIGDLYDIVWWAGGMVQAGKAVLAVREFLAGRAPVALKDDPAFTQHRDSLQKSLARVVKDSKARFRGPWGMVCLFWASGSRRSSGKLVTRKMTLDKVHPPPR